MTSTEKASLHGIVVSKQIQRILRSLLNKKVDIDKHESSGPCVISDGMKLNFWHLLW